MQQTDVQSVQTAAVRDSMIGLTASMISSAFSAARLVPLSAALC